MTRIERHVTITADMKTAADAQGRCGAYSQANPTTALRDNPHFREANRTFRKVGGLWVCACGSVNPMITEELTTACCGHDTVEIHRGR